jgi:hypothetical protein
MPPTRVNFSHTAFVKKDDAELRRSKMLINE